MKKLLFFLIIAAAFVPLSAQENISYRGFSLGSDRQASNNVIKTKFRSFQSEETDGPGGEKSITLKAGKNKDQDFSISLTFSSKGTLFRIKVKRNTSFKKINIFQKKIERKYGIKNKSGEFSNIETSLLDSSLRCSKPGADTYGRLLRCFYDKKGFQICRPIYGACFSLSVDKRYYIEILKQNRGIKQIIFEDRFIREKEKKKPFQFDFKEFD